MSVSNPEDWALPPEKKSIDLSREKRFQNPILRFLRVKPKHVCKYYLPRGDQTPEGFEANCVSCGERWCRYNYFDDDMYGGTAEYCGWYRVQEAL